MAKKKKIIFLSADTGGGHRASINALIQAIERIAPGKYELKRIEFFDRANPKLDRLIRAFYSQSISKFEWLWGLVYYTSNQTLVWKTIHPLYKAIYENVRKMYLHEKPDLIVSVHPMVNQITRKILDDMKLNTPFVVVTSDPVTLHLGWIEPGADLSVVSTKEAMERMIENDVPRGRIRLIGLPINPVFYDKVRDKRRIMEDFGIKPGRYTVLFSGGGDGGGKILPVVRALVKHKVNVQAIVACGRNEELKKAVSKLGVVAIPFTDKMHELMSVVDLMVIKAGPGTIEESYAKGLPMIITSYLPGQEKANIKYAKEKGRAFYEPETAGVISRIRKEMKIRRKAKLVPKSKAPVYKIARLLISVVEKKQHLKKA